MLRLLRSPASVKIAAAAGQPASWLGARGEPVPDLFASAKKIRQRWLADLTEYLDGHMRSSTFLECLRLELTIMVSVRSIIGTKLMTNSTDRGRPARPTRRIIP
jgi:hypothetical protein